MFFFTFYQDHSFQLLHLDIVYRSGRLVMRISQYAIEKYIKFGVQKRRCRRYCFHFMEDSLINNFSNLSINSSIYIHRLNVLLYFLLRFAIEKAQAHLRKQQQ